MNIQKYQPRVTTYILSTDEIAGGANKVMFDIFNNSGNETPPHELLLLAFYIAPKTDVAVTGAVSARFDAFRTTAIGTGGTSNSYAAPVSSAINITPMDSTASNLSGGSVSARSAPTGGATTSAWLFGDYVFPEETDAGVHVAQSLNLLPDGPQIEPFVLHPGQGMKVIQGSVASVNNFVFTLVFGRVQVKRV